MRPIAPTPRNLQPEDFQPHLGRTMRFGTVALELAQVEVHTAASFSLILRGPRSPILPDGSYEAGLAGRDLGWLYVSPIHTIDAARQDYQVVFNFAEPPQGWDG